MARRLLPGAVLIVAGLAAAPAAFADLGIDIAGFAFDPSPIRIHVGETVSWTNSDSVNHTATADDASFDTGSIDPGASTDGVRFDTVGTWTYHCTIHASMTGSIVVTAAAPATDTLDPSGPPPDPTPVAVVALAALGGLLIAGRRFGARLARSPASIED